MDATAIEQVDIESLAADPANVRKHGTRNLAAIKASLQRFGQQKPIVVDAQGVVRAGNGTLEAARSLGWKRIWITRTALTGSEATAYAIADNRTSELAEWTPELGLQLAALQIDDIPLETLGFTMAEFQELESKLAGEEPDAEEPAPDATEGEKDWNPAIRYELVFDSVEQQDRWFAFLKWLKLQFEFDAETAAGRLDLYLQSRAPIDEAA
jgi:ParB-like chromosome segregation protein Spo0J